MRAVHVSDTHGTFPKLPKDADLVLHTGDFCPNFVVLDRRVEAEQQEHWLRRKRFTIAKWLDGRPLIVVQGNHDFTQITGPNVKDITRGTHELQGLKFFGFPWVCPDRYSQWNWVTSEAGITLATSEIPDGTDVLMCHSPPYGCLDMCPGGNIGNPALLLRLAGMNNPPKWLLCGHVHESGGGVTRVGSTTIVNSATTMRVIEL